MRSLASLQKRFAEAVLDASAAPPEVKPGGTLTAETAIGVYRTAYPARLSEQLCETFEGVWSVLGDEAFFRRCREYIATNPSPYYNMSDYGAGFPEYLKTLPEAKQFPFLFELAEFEWAFKDLFHQKEHAPLDAQALARLTGESRPRFGAAVRLFRHKFHVAKIWNNRKETPPQPLPGERGGELLVAFKRDGEIYLSFFEEPEFAVLERLAGGASFEQALTAAGLDTERTTELFKFLGQSGIVESLDGGTP